MKRERHAYSSQVELKRRRADKPTMVAREGVVAEVKGIVGE